MTTAGFGRDAWTHRLLHIDAEVDEKGSGLVFERREREEAHLKDLASLYRITEPFAHAERQQESTHSF